jgi:phosphoribosylglycinamide formyltransferase 1
VNVRIAVLASGGGSNLQALIDRLAGSRSGEIGLVISDRAAAGALERARVAGIDAVHVPAGDASERMLQVLRDNRIDFIALAGYLRLVPADVVTAFRDRMVNVHPALLPAFGGPGMYGRHVHAAVIAAGCTISGPTVHWVDERYDEGRIIAQWPVPVLPGDTADSLGARVLRMEHRLYPAVVEALVRGGSAEREPAYAGDIFRLGHDTNDLDAGIIGLSRLSMER